MDSGNEISITRNICAKEIKFDTIDDSASKTETLYEIKNIRYQPVII